MRRAYSANSKRWYAHSFGQTIKAIPLSDSSVQRRVDEMAENVEDALCNMLRTTWFSLQFDEATLPGNESLLLAYVRFVKDESLVW